MAFDNRLSAIPVAQLTSNDIDRMTGDQYKTRLADPEFAKKVNEIEAAKPPRPTKA